jgi:hypothetical protein
MAKKKSEKNDRATVEREYSPEVKKKARVVGVVITSCPECNNPVNFDRKNQKICPYCEAEVQIDLDKIEVMVRTVTEIKIPKGGRREE